MKDGNLRTIWRQTEGVFGVCADGYIVAWTKGGDESHGVAVTAFTPLCVASDLSRSAVNDMAPTNMTRGAAIDRQGPQRERSRFPQPSGFAFEWNIEFPPWCRKFYRITACLVSVFLKFVGSISLLAEIGREVYIYRSSVQRSIFTRWR